MHSSGLLQLDNFYAAGFRNKHLLVLKSKPSRTSSFKICVYNYKYCTVLLTDTVQLCGLLDNTDDLNIVNALLTTFAHILNEANWQYWDVYLFCYQNGLFCKYLLLKSRDNTINTSFCVYLSKRSRKIQLY